MAENAYVFYHPQYGGLRVVYYDGELFFCLEDLVAITSIGRETLFPVLADTEGKVVEMYVEAETKKVPKDFKPRLFFGEFFGNADKVERKGKICSLERYDIRRLSGGERYDHRLFERS